MELGYKIIYKSNMEDGEYVPFWKIIREQNEKLYSYMWNSLMSDSTLGIRDDVLRFLGENISFLPKENSGMLATTNSDRVFRYSVGKLF